MSLSASVGVQIPTNVIEVGNEISQVAIDAIAASASPSNVNPMMTSSAVTGLGYIGDAPSNGSEYVRKNAAWSVATGGGGATAASQLTNATYTTNPTAAPTTAGDVLSFNGTALVWAAGGGGGLTISTLSNGATSTLDATAPTTGQALTFDGTDLAWATVGGGGGAVWGSVTGTLSSQTDLQSALDAKLSPRTVNTVGSGPYTIQLTDANKVVHLASGGMGFGTTLELDANIAYVDGTVIFVTVDNPAYTYSINAPFGGGVTINAGSTYNITGGVTTLIKVSANTWCAG